MLSAGQIEQLRANVESEQHRPQLGPEQIAICDGGPLHGMRVRVEAGASIFSPGIKDHHDVVLAVYEHLEWQPQWVFKGYERTKM